MIIETYIEDTENILIEEKIKPYLNIINNKVNNAFPVNYGYIINNKLYSLINIKKGTPYHGYLIIKGDTLKQNILNIIEIYNLKNAPIQIKLSIIEQAHKDLSTFKETESLLALLNLHQHQITLSNILALTKLNPKLIEYSQDKQFSLKQLIRFKHYNTKFIDWMLAHIIIPLAPSASITLELMESLHDILKRQKLSLNELNQTLSIEQVLNSHESNKIKLQDLRNIIYQHKYPTLTKHNNRLQNILNNIPLPKKASINWDKTLETKELSINIRVENNYDFNAFNDLIKEKKALSTLLNGINNVE